MKVEVECAACIFHRGYLEIIGATNDPSVQFKAISAFARFLAKEFKTNKVPAFLGTGRDRLIKRLTGNPDPYVKKKRLSNQMALEILPLTKKLVSNQSCTESRFRKACLSSIVGNIIEFGIPDHVFKFQDIKRLILRAEEDLAIDEISKIFDTAKKAN
ncbi:MAG: ARMT1-like domain-containing protein, partial [Candidatus Bathyarchaeota archaeon]|nr:ARMT1-like domain-containing protein [Candidatus Bathyarchaeota archaeon]